ncbi:RNA polymerase sigma factor [Nevskia soli]|jgi:RNA polymerase sigma-70 factor (ECF subfamily)|uniref:RNA polymerase sigma factor n=1 Tax=Nevskia soli TaxID=418856 RepID=UPI0015D7CE9C|nr:sigma-70 family RNA polymerase sigma factor [Nevskia soli]
MAFPIATATLVPADFEMLEGCRRGEAEAFRLLFETYKDRVYSFALRFLGDESRAADLTQDVFVKLYDRIAEFRGDARFETWLYRIVANACIDDQRRRKKWLPWLNQEPPAHVGRSNSGDDRLVRRETEGAVQQAIGKLSPALRAPILLRYVEGLSYEEIGETLSLSPGTVASRLSRAHRLLARKLEKFKGMAV